MVFICIFFVVFFYLYGVNLFINHDKNNQINIPTHVPNIHPSMAIFGLPSLINDAYIVHVIMNINIYITSDLVNIDLIESPNIAMTVITFLKTGVWAYGSSFIILANNPRTHKPRNK